LLADIKVFSIKNPGAKFYVSTFGLPLIVSGVFSFYKYQQMRNDLDKKYTPIYLKSRGKL
jgi:hypothetical protein